MVNGGEWVIRTLVEACLVALILSLSLFLPRVVNASNPKIGEGALEREMRGSSYWQSSNLREWLNSEAGPGRVQYTNQPPTRDKLGSYAYDQEPGFLYEFTSAEKNAIAVTEHRVILSPYDANQAKDGGTKQLPANFYYGPSMTFSLPGLSQEYVNYFYQRVNDKVFLLNPYEVQRYIQRRGWSLEKRLTEKAKQKHGISKDTYHWWIQGPTGGNGREYNYHVRDDDTNIDYVYNHQPSGIVPAIQIKPNATVDGRRASQLRIGDLVTFGRYMGEPILWRVININKQGYPLLLSEYVLDLKPFDAPGDDFSYKYSNYINFPNHDSTIFDHDHYRTVSGSTDREPPVITLVNENEMFKRQNNSFTLVFDVTDNYVGVKHTILPNGTVTTSQRFSYTITENKHYLFRAADRNDNYSYLTLPIGNINPPSHVIVQPSTTDWTNKDVTVDIFASNDIGFTISQADQTGRDIDFQTLPNYTSYAGKRFRISGSVELIEAKTTPTWQDARIGFYYQETHKEYGEYTQRHVWDYRYSVRLSRLMQNGRNHFDFIFEVPGTYYSGLRAIGQINVPFADRNYHIRWHDVTYELIDDEDFYIKRIILPDGKSIYNNRYTHTLTKSGTYVYKVEDSRGKITERSVTVKIDKEGPNIDVTYDNNPARSVKLLVSAHDDGIGLKEIILPNGEKVSGSSYTYEATSNGTYTFEAIDLLGNKSKKSVTINNIDRTPPELRFKVNPTGWTRKPVQIKAIASDQNGIDRIILPDKTSVYSSQATYTVTNNGRYVFEAVDGAGNRRTATIEITNIDTGLPHVHIREMNKTNNKIDVRLEYGD